MACAGAPPSPPARGRGRSPTCGSCRSRPDISPSCRTALRGAGGPSPRLGSWTDRRRSTPGRRTDVRDSEPILTPKPLLDREWWYRCPRQPADRFQEGPRPSGSAPHLSLSLIHISEPTRLLSISYAVFCLK